MSRTLEEVEEIRDRFVARYIKGHPAWLNGHGIGLDSNNQMCIKVYVLKGLELSAPKLPPFFEGVRIIVESTGRAVAQSEVR